MRFRQQSLEAEQPIPSSGRASIPPSNHCASPLNQNGSRCMQPLKDNYGHYRLTISLHFSGPGISVTRTFKVGDQLMFRYRYTGEYMYIFISPMTAHCHRLLYQYRLMIHSFILQSRYSESYCFRLTYRSTHDDYRRVR